MLKNGTFFGLLYIKRIPPIKVQGYIWGNSEWEVDNLSMYILRNWVRNSASTSVRSSLRRTNSDQASLQFKVD